MPPWTEGQGVRFPFLGGGGRASSSQAQRAMDSGIQEAGWLASRDPGEHQLPILL